MYHTWKPISPVRTSVLKYRIVVVIIITYYWIKNLPACDNHVVCMSRLLTSLIVSARCHTTFLFFAVCKSKTWTDKDNDSHLWKWKVFVNQFNSKHRTYNNYCSTIVMKYADVWEESDDTQLQCWVCHDVYPNHWQLRLRLPWWIQVVSGITCPRILRVILFTRSFMYGSTSSDINFVEHSQKWMVSWVNGQKWTVWTVSILGHVDWLL